MGLAALLFLAASAVPATPPVAEVARRFASPPDDARVMMRWWWFGPSVTREEIEAEMRAMKAGGIGGFELAVVYPMALDDPERGLRNERYLSPEFLEKVTFAAAKARELGLRMDVTLGSGWSYGGPHITPTQAAARLRSERREIAPSVSSVARPVPLVGDELLAAYVARGAVREIDPRSIHPLDISGSGPIAIPRGDGPRTLLFYYTSRTGQVVKRAALGAEGYVLDHYQRPALETHLREMGEVLLGAVGSGGVRAVFCDSLEVYDADWTTDLAAEFERRRGYGLLPVLPLLDLDLAEESAALRRDFGRTLSELYEERFLVPMREWTRRHGVVFRIQNYGVPPASLASARHADLADGEGWQHRSLTASRWASSAGHLLGNPVIASETWTWLHSPPFRATPLDMKAEADQHFLSGINQLIGHGWPYSPRAAGRPGWPFYAAAVLSDANPWWPVMPQVSAYLQRLSALLREGEPVADVALYAPTFDAWSTFKPGTPGYMNLFQKTVEWIGPQVVPKILDAGHSFDLVDDGLLEHAARRGYKVVLLPGVVAMPEETRRWLAAFEDGGGKVLAIWRKPEGDWPSLEVVSEGDLAGRLAAIAPPDLVLRPPNQEIGFVHRRMADGEAYFLANTSQRPQFVQARLRDHEGGAEEWDPMTGARAPLKVADGEVALSFAPYASRVVVFRRDGQALPPATAVPTEIVSSDELRTGWKASFAGEPVERSINVELPWSWGDAPARRHFSGAVSYRRWVPTPPVRRGRATRVFLDFGEARPSDPDPFDGAPRRANSFVALATPPIREAATVFVNGRRAGVLWAPPYRIELTGLLRGRTNEIRIDVYNTALNHLAEGKRLPDMKDDMKAVVERYGLRARLQELEAVRPLPSGLLSVPRLIVVAEAPPAPSATK